MVKELELAKSRLREVRDEAIAKESTAVKHSTVQVLASSREVETRILQDELKRLSDISIQLGKKVESAEQAVSVVCEEQERIKIDSQARADVAR